MNTKNLFSFTDVDRDGMVDMIYVEQGPDNVNMYVHFNKLLNADRETPSEGGFGVKHICSSTIRPINLIKDIFVSPDAARSLLDAAGVVQSSYVVRTPFEAVNEAGVVSKTGITEIKSVSASMPGRLHLGDIS